MQSWGRKSLLVFKSEFCKFWFSAENFALLNGTSISRFYGYAPPNSCYRVDGFCINVIVFITHALSFEPILLFVNKFSFYIFYYKQYEHVMFFLFVIAFSNLSNIKKILKLTNFLYLLKRRKIWIFNFGSTSWESISNDFKRQYIHTYIHPHCPELQNN